MVLTVGYVGYVWGGTQGLPLLASALPEPFEVARERSGVGMCEDVVQLRQDVRGVSLERLLRNRPVCHRKKQCILLENGEGGEGGEEQPIDIER